MTTLLIAGASYAGAQLAGSARDAGFDGRIVVFGDEPHLPYQRPHLSKGYLSGALDASRLPLRSADYYKERAITLHLGARVTSIAPDTRQFTLADGATHRYDWLALATGARARTLDIPGAALQGVLPLRSLDDAELLRAHAPHARRVCVIGGGFIGLEVAAVLAATGAAVTVLEAGERLFMRSLPAPLAHFMAAAHLKRGVAIHFKQTVRALHGGAAGHVAAVELADGSRLECDLVVAGIGVLPNVELASAAGILCSDGIVVDAGMRTSSPHILAVGDCARQPHPEVAAGVRLESIQAANDMARAAAATILGLPPPPLPVPWFWSDQFDLKVQMAGLGAPGDELVLRGDMGTDKFTMWALRAGRVAAAYSVNQPGVHLQARKFIAAGSTVPALQLADPLTDLKSLLAGA